MLAEVAKYIMTVDMFPVFFFAHFTLVSVLIREDSKSLGPKFRQKHPMTSWFCTIIAALSGVFVESFLFGDSMVNIFKEHALITFATVIWYLVNFSPFDLVYKIVMFPPVIISFSILQECLRVRFVYLGLQVAAKAYPSSYLIILIGGIIKGNGYGFLKIVERLVRGIWEPTTNEILDSSYFTKTGVIASLLFLFHHVKILDVPIEFLYSGIVLAFVVGRLALMLLGITNPFKSLEAPICELLFGNANDDDVSVKMNGQPKTSPKAKKEGKNKKKD